MASSKISKLVWRGAPWQVVWCATGFLMEGELSMSRDLRWDVLVTFLQRLLQKTVRFRKRALEEFVVI
jgi:hypothetical protein